MKIFRYFPDVNHFASAGIGDHPSSRWWPKGISLPGEDQLEVRSEPPGTDSLGPVYKRSGDDRPLSDFPMLALNVPVASPRAAELLSKAGVGVVAQAPLRIGGVQFHALQPTVLRDVVRLNESVARVLPNGVVLHLVEPMFDDRLIAADLFCLDLPHVYSCVYVTERFASLVNQGQLHGLDLELVYDSGKPVAPRNLRFSTRELLKSRAVLAEEFILLRRAEWDGEDRTMEIHRYIDEACSKGWLRGGGVPLPPLRV